MLRMNKSVFNYGAIMCFARDVTFVKCDESNCGYDVMTHAALEAGPLQHKGSLLQWDRTKTAKKHNRKKES